MIDLSKKTKPTSKSAGKIYGRVVFVIDIPIITLLASIIIILIWVNHTKNSFYRDLFELEAASEGELDFVQLAKNILSCLLKKTGAIGGILYWYDEAQNEFKLKTLAGIPAEKISQITQTLRQPHSILEQAQTLKSSLIIRDLRSAPRLQQVRKIQALSDYCRSIMVIPLTAQKRPQGLAVLFGVKGTFKTKYRKMMDAFAPRAAINLDNSRLYQLAKETTFENARLYLNLSNLSKRVTLDELTGLYDRNFFMQRIKAEVKQAWRFKQPLSVIFIDLDYFKKVNDQFGHQVGDQLLMEFAQLLRETIREYDIPCRFGGEEFMVLLPHTKLNNAFLLAERIRAKVSAATFCEPINNFKVTVSLGVSALAEFPEALAQLDASKVDASVANLISRADDALYCAKNEGRNQVKSVMLL